MKILIINLKKSPNFSLINELVTALKFRFPNAVFDLAVSKDGVNFNFQNINEIHIYDPSSIKGGGIFKKIFYELKFILKIKKQKYSLAVQPTSSSKGILVAKQAKIKTIASYECKNKKIAKFITNAIKDSGKNECEDVLKALNLEPLSDG